MSTLIFYIYIYIYIIYIYITFILGYLPIFSLTWSAYMMYDLLTRNNSIYQYRACRDDALRTVRKKTERWKKRWKKDGTGGFCGAVDKFRSFWKDIYWKIRLFTKYKICPGLQLTPALLFRLSAYFFILSYLAEYYVLDLTHQQNGDDISTYHGVGAVSYTHLRAHET